ncbi:MAG TPA: NAD(P)-dependent oxidoreductase, partial [Stellaceae bacterium]|nr:NAD(P)-dependent oxidoreductase [Stellaceae bacterium]
FDPAAFEVLRAEKSLSFEILAAGGAEVMAEQAACYDAIVLLMPRVTARTLAGAGRRLRIVARFGVGYDNVDTDACTRAGVVLTITPDGVRRPVATIILTFVLALSHRLFVKDRLTKAGRWNERTDHMGVGLTGKVFGSIGFGNIGREAFRLLRPLDMVHIACDPVARPEDAAALGVRLVDLDTLLREADFVSVNCPLSPATRHLVDAAALAKMKPTAFLINTARGPIVDEAALTAALAARRIAGAALDVFDQEPTPADNPLLALDNVITTPHSLCWTDECFRRIAEDAFSSVVAMARGEVPVNVVNRAVLGDPAFVAALAARRKIVCGDQS